MKWVLILHFYQPPKQNLSILREVVGKSYVPIIKLLKEHPRVHVNVNFNGCLTDQLGVYYPEVLRDVVRLFKRGQIEFLGSARNHAFLPLISEKEIRKQIVDGKIINSRLLGDINFRPNAFFPSELAYAHKIFRAVTSEGYKSMLVDEISVAGRLSKLDWDVGYRKNDQIDIIPVNRKWSSELRSNQNMDDDKFIWYLKEEFSENKFLISANDGELFGHHYVGRLNLLKRVFNDGQIEFVKIEEYLKSRKVFKNVNLVPGTWETNDQDIRSKLTKNNDPYPLWFDLNNQIQLKMWELAWMAISSMENYVQPSNDEGWKWHSARDHLDNGLSSCYWWWASCKPWWNPEMIEKGVEHLARTIRASNVTWRRKLIADRLRSEIISLVWKWHWSGEAQKRVDNFERLFKKGLYWVRTQPVLW